MPVESIVRNTIRYVDIPSVSGKEGPLADQIVRDFAEIGYTNIERINPNSLALLIPGKNRKRLFVINSHIDTVVFNTPPKARREGDYVVGLGSGDDKAGAAIQLDLAEEYKSNPPPCDVLLTFSACEEVGGDGSVAAAQWFKENHTSRYEVTGGIILEPTYDDAGGFVGFGHRGGEKFTVTAKGERAHGGKNLKGEIAAITRLANLLADVPMIQSEWERYADAFGVPTLNVTRIHAGEADNIVPDVATALLDIRSTHSFSQAWDALRIRLEEEYGIIITAQESEDNLHVSECPPETLIYQAVKAALPDVRMDVFPYATDQSGWSKYGDVPMMMYGPGYIPFMHSNDDRVHTDAINEVRENIPKIIVEFANK